MKRYKFTPQEITKIHQVVMMAQPDRHALLAGIVPGFVTGLAIARRFGDQILLDLHALNDTEELSDGSDPLGTWLLNAKTLVPPTSDSEILDQYLRLRDSGLAGVLEPHSDTDSLSPNTSRVLAEIARAKTPFWELRLLAVGLAEEIARSADLKNDLIFGVTLGEPLIMGDADFAGWAGAQLSAIVRMMDSMKGLLNNALPRALGPPGVPANPKELLYISRRMGDVYREALEWAIRWRRVHVSVMFDRLIEISSGYVGRILAEFENWRPRVERQIDEHLAAHGTGGSKVLNVVLTMEPEGQNELMEEVARLSREAPWRTQRY